LGHPVDNAPQAEYAAIEEQCVTEGAAALALAHGLWPAARHPQVATVCRFNGPPPVIQVNTWITTHFANPGECKADFA